MYHLPHLLLSVFSELVQKETQLTTRELRACFSLVLYVITELLNSSASRSNSVASTPSTPLPHTPADSPSLGRAAGQFAATQWQLSEDAFTRQFEELKSLITVNYLEFFARLLGNRVLNQQGRYSTNSSTDVRGHLKATFSSACELLLLLARLSPNMAAVENEHTDTPAGKYCLVVVSYKISTYHTTCVL